MPNFQIERLKKLSIRRTSEVWEVAAMPLPATAPMKDGGKPEQLAACVCVSSEGGAMTSELQTVEHFDDSAGIDALSRFALDPHVPGARPLNYLPAKVRIGPMPEESVNALAAALQELGVAIEVKDEAPMAFDFLKGLAQHISGNAPGGDNAHAWRP